MNFCEKNIDEAAAACYNFSGKKIEKRGWKNLDGVTLVENPLISHYMGIIRDRESDKNAFSNAIEALVYLMIPEITNDLKTSEKAILTPLAEARVDYFCENVLIIPILRAGMAMLEPLKRIIPNTVFGYFGMKRVTDSATSAIYAEMHFSNLPPNLGDYQIMILDIVIATASSISRAIENLLALGAKQENIQIVGILAARPGIEILQKHFPKINISVCAIDEKLDENGYIVPGLGDAGDRYNGYVSH